MVLHTKLGFSLQQKNVKNKVSKLIGPFRKLQNT